MPFSLPWVSEVASLSARKRFQPGAGILFNAAAHEFAEGKELGIEDGVAGEVAFLLPGDKAGIQEHAEMLGDIPLFHAGGSDEFGDRHGLCHERSQQFQTRRLREDGKQFRHFLKLRVGHCWFG
jgi:hypothetical protein